MKIVILQVFYIIFSALMEALAIPNEILLFGSPCIALFSLFPLYLTLYKAKSYKASFFYMAIHAFVVHITSSFWLANFKDFAIFTLGASALGTALEAGLVGILFHILPEQYSKAFYLEQNSGKHAFSIFNRILWFCSIWIIWEWTKSTGFLGYPWGTMFLAAYKWKIFTQIADITGMWGISFIFAFFSAVLAEGFIQFYSAKRAILPYKLKSNYIQTVKFLLTIILISGFYGLWQYFIPRMPEKHVNTIAVQQNIDPWEGGEKLSMEISKELTEKAVEAFHEQELEPDLVLWSEGILLHPFPASRFYYLNNPEEESLSDFITKIGVPFIIGGLTLVNPEKKHYANSAILFDKEGTYSGFYSKIHLVPFAEAIPFKDTEIMKFLTKNILGFSSCLTQGNQYTLFKIPLSSSKYNNEPLEYKKERFSIIPLNNAGISNNDVTWNYIKNTEENKKSYVKFSTPICFEDAFPSVCSKLHNIGSEVFFNITNDSWSKTASAEYQHFAIASYLSIEYRTTLVRCTNSGYSVVIDPAGKIIDKLNIFTRDVMCTKVPVFKHRQTIYALYGDWFVYSIFVLISLYLIVTMVKINMSKIRNFSISKIIDSIEQFINNI